MNIVEIRPARGARRTWITLAVAVGLSLSLAATTALAQPTGIVQIKGKRYVDGEESKVKCSKTEGNMLDATALGTRVFTLANTPDCLIFTDTPGDAGVLTFTGLEDMIAKNTIVKARYIFSGVETGGLVSWRGPGHPAGQVGDGALHVPQGEGHDHVLVRERVLSGRRLRRQVRREVLITRQPTAGRSTSFPASIHP